MPRLARWYWRRAGFRGSFLLVLGVTDILAGCYLLVAGLPPARNVLFIDESAWGGIWIGAGLVLLTGVLSVSDRLQFAAASLLKFAWSLEFFRLGLEHGITAPVPVRHLWLAGLAWVGAALAVLLVSAWPEPPGAGAGRGGEP